MAQRAQNPRYPTAYGTTLAPGRKGSRDVGTQPTECLAAASRHNLRRLNQRCAWFWSQVFFLFAALSPQIFVLE